MDIWQLAYATKLKRALAVVEPQIPIPSLSLSVVTVEALKRFHDDWRDRTDRRVSWDWTENDFRPPKGLNLAIWHEGNLCGLASGDLGSSKAVRVNYVEAFPGLNPLKRRVIPITLTCAEAYGRQIGSKVLKVCDVIPPLRSVYEGYGFELAPESKEGHVVMRKAIE